MKSVIRQHKMHGLVWNLREGASDWRIVREIYERNEYSKAEFSPNDTWLDAGANFGAFLLYAAQKVRWVCCVEPFGSSYRLLLRNAKDNQVANFSVINALLVGDDRKVGTLFVSPRGDFGANTECPTRGRLEVSCSTVNVNEVVATYGVNKVKMDIEGAELGVILGMTDETIRAIEQLLVEIHPRSLGVDMARAMGLIDEKLAPHLVRTAGRDVQPGYGGWPILARYER